jgi:Abnormal spindle-like microcephaly-assoc'd, ASPM-SPD-2-Hydin
MASTGESPDGLLVGLGVNGTAGAKSSSDPTTNWPQVLDGYGGQVPIDSTNPSSWYANNQAGVAIHLCAQSDPCTPADFGTAAVTSADVSGDGNAMPNPAPFLVDPLDASQLLIGTCRVWRGPASGVGWSSENAVSPFLDGQHKSACSGDPLIRSITALALADGSEVIYLGMYSVLDGGGALPGHVFSARVDPTSSSPAVWNDLTANPVTNAITGMNAYGLDVSSIVIDPHDPTGNTVYVTVEGIPEAATRVRSLYRSIDGGATWQSMISNLPLSPANALAIDPQDPNTVYIALDAGVFSTRDIGNCISTPNACWSAYGTGLPLAPVTQLSVAGSALIAGTYGRGLWQIPLSTAGTPLTTADAAPTSLLFPAQPVDSASSVQTVTVTNTGATSLAISSIVATGDFDETDNCQNIAIAAGGNCAVQVTFTPSQSGTRTGQITVAANVAGGQIAIDLSGIGVEPAGVTLTPPKVNFEVVAVGTTSAALQVTAENATSAAVAITSVGVSGPFVVSTNGCGTSLAANSDCQLLIEFSPAQAGAATGTLTLLDGGGTQTVGLSGNGAAPPTDTLTLATLAFPGTVVGQISQAQTITMTNSGGLPLTSIAATTSGPFQVSSNCTSQLGANSTCAFSVLFDPTATGTQTGILTIADALHTQTVSLAGTGLAPPQIKLDHAH